MPVGQEAAADSFYAGVLGLEPVEKPAHLAARGGRWFRTEDGFEIHLGVEEPFVPARKAHPALLVDDGAAMRAALEAREIPVVTDTALAGFERFYTEDPFGNRIEILTPSTQ